MLKKTWGNARNKKSFYTFPKEICLKARTNDGSQLFFLTTEHAIFSANTNYINDLFSAL